MNDFTKEELQYFLMAMKPFQFLWKGDPLKLENKVQSMIDNYCEHNYVKTLDKSGMYFISMCHQCGDSKPWSVLHE